MVEVFLIKSINEAIPFVILIFMGIGLYRGFKKNQAFLSEREDLLKRYLLSWRSKGALKDLWR